MSDPVFPSLFQVNTRVWLTRLSRGLGRPATLDDIPDARLDRLAAMGFDWVWLLSVWQTGPTSRQVSRTIPELRREFAEVLPDLTDDDIAGSGFAITGYTVHHDLGGDSALARLRRRLASRGLKLMLDFVPNHTGLDHPWIEQHPHWYVGGGELDLIRAPGNYTRIQRDGRDFVLAHGRDPFFPGWTDTVQLNYANPELQEGMILELERIAGQCDGVRCDMAMLVLPDVFLRTWGLPCKPFWPAAIRRVREHARGFLFMAEVYWDLEWTLQQQGFDYTYDKRLYDRLREGHARPVREHLAAPLEYQSRMARFLENHDEPRAAAVFPSGMHRAAAVITYLAPGLRFFHQGQLEGWSRRISPHLSRGPDEAVNEELKRFYRQLLSILSCDVVRRGNWLLLQARPAWDGNGTADCFVSFAWQAGEFRLVVAVNFAANQSQCYVPLPFPELNGRSWRLRDLMSPAAYDRDGANLESPGLYLDLGPWQYHVCTLESPTPRSGSEVP